jgi:N-6 DNA Methylase
MNFIASLARSRSLMPSPQTSEQLGWSRARAARYERSLGSKRRKALGQFFTGLPLGRLLAAIAFDRDISSVIDPMAGHGDLLDAVAERAARTNHHLKHLHAVEIDAPIAELCRERVEQWKHQADETTVRTGNAFDPELGSRYLSAGYDLVIANPPYVRYQTLAASDDGVSQLSPREIRRNLGELVAGRAMPEELRSWRGIVERYSGFSDLAVPSWILSASLVRRGGVLALVAPATWRSRNYGATIEYLLGTFFHLEYLIEDTQPGWFSDVLVRTQLVVARRIALAKSHQSIPLGPQSNQAAITVKVSPSAGGNGSLVGSSFLGDDPEGAFAAWLGSRARGEGADVLGISVQEGANLKERRFLSPSHGRDRRMGNRINRLFDSRESPANLVPPALQSLFDGAAPVNLVLVETAGISVSQGLRTGCNGFFYVDHIETSDPDTRIRLSSLFGKQEITVPADCVKPVVRRQSEYTGPVGATQLTGRVLDLESWALPEDMEIVNANRHLYERENIPLPKILPTELAHFIRRAARTVYTNGNEPRPIPHLSAVRTNNRPPGKDRTPRFWYMLPPFARRHRPDAFVPRVNQRIPWVEINDDPPVLIDANFSTIWGERPHWTRFALRALLNTLWCRACMEALGTPLGGGALKLEATQLRSLPIPSLHEADLSVLDAQGRALPPSASSVPEAVDRLVLAKITGLPELNHEVSKLLKGLETTADSLCRERQRTGA